MTRQEAEKKCFNTFKGKKIELGDIVVNQLLDMLEALGVVEFDKEIEEPKSGQLKINWEKKSEDRE